MSCIRLYWRDSPHESNGLCRHWDHCQCHLVSTSNASDCIIIATSPQLPAARLRSSRYRLTWLSRSSAMSALSLDIVPFSPFLLDLKLKKSWKFKTKSNKGAFYKNSGCSHVGLRLQAFYVGLPHVDLLLVGFRTFRLNSKFYYHAQRIS